tara:strand:+ start:143 stop:271 length:129 start_codon:yes stop_codon:yes gene_type:complete
MEGESLKLVVKEAVCRFDHFVTAVLDRCHYHVKFRGVVDDFD